MTDSTQRELRMLANRMLTQTEARNGYQCSPVCLLLRKDAEKAMALMTKAADLVDVLESSLRLQAEVAADANAQANTMRRLLDEERAQEPNGTKLYASVPVPAQPATIGTVDARYRDLLSRLGVDSHDGAIAEINDLRMEAGLNAAPSQQPTLPLEIAGSLRPDDYVSPRLAAEAYRENE